MIECDVIIVGAGPVGMTLGNLLGQYHVNTVMVEKRSELLYLPRAVSVDDEALRIWQECGLLDQALPYIKSSQIEGEVLLNYRDHLGKNIFSLRNQFPKFGHPKAVSILQFKIDEVLKNGLERFPHVALHLSHQALEVSQENGFVLLKVKSPDGIKQIKAKYLLACDGENSVIRECCQIPMKGFKYKRPWLVVDVIENNPSLEAVEVWCDYRRPMATIPLAEGYRRFEFLLPKIFKLQEVMKKESIIARIKSFKDIEVAEVTRHFIYYFSAKMIARYSQGNIFFLGDAAHLTPPFAGQGLSTGLRDVANLSWKIASVLRRQLSADILSTYEVERRPHQKKMIRLAVNLGRLMMPMHYGQMILQNNVMAFLNRIPVLRKMVEIRGSQISPVYKMGYLKVGNLAGTYFPQPIIDGTLFDQHLGNWFSVLAINADVTEFFSDDELNYWQKMGAKLMKLTHQQAQFFAKDFDLSKRHLLVIRPDRFIYQHKIL